MEEVKLKRKLVFSLFVVSAIIVATMFNLISISLNSNVISNSNSLTSYNFNEDTIETYNILVENEATGAEKNITQLNITLPSSFVFINGTNSTTATSNIFSEINNTLIWTGDNIVPALSSINFIFNATVTLPGVYNITIIALNSTGIESQNIFITINDSSSPTAVSFVSPSENDNSAFSRTYIKYNISAQDDGTIDRINVYLYNSTFSLINSTNAHTTSLNGNFSGLVEGTYYMNATANDTVGHINYSETRTFILDKTAPIISLDSPSANATLNVSSYRFAFNVSSLSGIANCSLILDESIEEVDNGIEVNSLNRITGLLTNGLTYEWQINCIDLAGNIGNSSIRTFTVIIPSSATSSSTTSVTDTSTSTNITIIALNTSQIKSSYEDAFPEGTEIEFNILNESHSLKITNLTSDNVSITVSSTPQKATLSVGEEKKFELSEDNYFDLKVTLNSIVNNQANLTIKEIHEIMSSTPQTGSSEESLQEEKSKKLIFIMIVSIMVISLVILGVIFYLKNVKNKKNRDNLENNQQSMTNNFPPNYPPKTPPLTSSIVYSQPQNFQRHPLN